MNGPENPASHSARPSARCRPAGKTTNPSTNGRFALADDERHAEGHRSRWPAQFRSQFWHGLSVASGSNSASKAAFRICYTKTR